MGNPVPYRSTGSFDEHSLPAAFRRAHSTKAGVWGVIRMAEGRAALRFFDGTAERIVTPEMPAMLLPGQPHALETIGPGSLQPLDLTTRRSTSSSTT